MSLTGGYFTLFFALLLPLYYALPRRMQKPLLLLASLVFYAFAGWENLLLILGMSSYAYLGGRLLQGYRLATDRVLAQRSDWEKQRRKTYKKQRTVGQRGLLLLFTLPLLASLAYFKYIPTLMNIGLIFPLGLSFFTFQLLGYLIDVSRGTVACEKKLWQFWLFSCYFPQMVQGPISRFGELKPTLLSPVQPNLSMIGGGAFRLLWGWIKKMIIADTASLAVRAMMGEVMQYRGGGVLLLILLYSVQIYADFTGGMDIALGCSEMLGVRLRENFDHPFSATSVKEYWRRWHISMGRWFTDYVFYPLSLSLPFQRLSRISRRLLGEKLGKRVPVWTATMITWLATGVWHGAGWNFLLWGALNGVTILVAQELQPLRRALRERSPRYNRYTQGCCHHALCCCFIFLLMGLFRTLDVYKNVPLTLRMWASLLDFGAWRDALSGAFWNGLTLSMAQWSLLIVGVALMSLISHLTKTDVDATSGKWATVTPVWGEALRARLCRRPLLLAMLLAIMAASVLIFGQYGFGYDGTSFIYNQF